MTLALIILHSYYSILCTPIYLLFIQSYFIFFLHPFAMFQVNLEYLESKLESVDGEEVQRIQDNINSLFHHCVQALGEEHQIKVVNALQVTEAQEDHIDSHRRVTVLKHVDTTLTELKLSLLVRFIDTVFCYRGKNT